LYVLNPVNGALLAKQDLDPRAVPGDDAEAEVESSPVIAHFLDGSDRILVGNGVHNDAGKGRTGLHSFALVADEDGPTPYRLDRVTGTRPWTSHPAQSGHLNPGFAFGGMIGTPAVGAVNGQPAIFIASALSSPIGDPETGEPDPTLAEDPQRMLSLHAISAADG